MPRRKVQMEDYSGFIRYIKKQSDIKTQKDWQAHYKSVIGPNNLPYPINPQRQYGQEWEGWYQVTGSDNISTRVKSENFISLRELRDICRRYHIQTMKEYFEFVQQVGSEFNLPSNPYNTYKEEWIEKGKSDYILEPIFLDYKDACKVVKKYKFQTRAAYLDAVKEGVIKKDLEEAARKDASKKGKKLVSISKVRSVPYHPDRYYNEWQDWNEYLGK